MFGKLKRRFIMLAMIAITSVLLIVLLLLNLIYFGNVRDNADTLLNSIVENGGTLAPEKFFGNNEFWSEELVYETRYFSVLVEKQDESEDGNEIHATVNVDKIAAVDARNAVSYAMKIIDSGRKSGYYIGKYRFICKEVESGTMVVFVDCYRQMTLVRMVVKMSISILLLTLAAVFLIIMLLSDKVIAPFVRSYEKQKRFITDAGHELKTPLSIISANNELLEMDYGENECTDGINKQIARMTQMTKNLTLLSKLDEMNDSSQKTRFSITDALFDVSEQYMKIAENKGKSIVRDIHEGIEFVGNEALIRQLFGITIDNAMKYSLGEIKLKLDVVKGKIVYKEENEAESLKQGDLSKYCDRFFRSDESRASGIDGSGIGLSIAKDIVALSGGKIYVSSPDGKTFQIKVIL